MCFDRLEDFGNTRSGSFPTPTEKPELPNTGTSGSILGDIFDLGKSVFKDIASIELGAFEAKKIAEIRALENKASEARTQDLAGQNLSQPLLQGMSNQNLIFAAVGLGLVGAFVISRS